MSYVSFAMQGWRSSVLVITVLLVLTFIIICYKTRRYSQLACCRLLRTPIVFKFRKISICFTIWFMAEFNGCLFENLILNKSSQLLCLLSFVLCKHVTTDFIKIMKITTQIKQIIVSTQLSTAIILVSWLVQDKMLAWSGVPPKHVQ